MPHRSDKLAGGFCTKTGKRLTYRRRHKLLRWIFPTLGLASLIWFLLRVIPKPSRATYPCQRLAAPLATSFVLWISGIIGSAFAYRKARELFRTSRMFKAVCFLALAAVAALCALVNTPSEPVLAEDAVSNAPIGVARGIHPGRVVWTYDAEATDWAGTNFDGEDIGDGYCWQSNHTNQDVVDLMMSKTLRDLAGEPNDVLAWQAIFRHFNRAAGKGDIPYQEGERIAAKINLVTAICAYDHMDEHGNQMQWLGWVNTSPQMIVALLRQLVYVVGVDQNDITVGDTTTYFPNHYWDYCRAEFQSVHYLAATDDWGRCGTSSSQGTAYETPAHWSTTDADGKIPDYLPVSYAQAAYLINFACLKGHSSGITLCAKNHYGSLIRTPGQEGYYDLHSSLPNQIYSPGRGNYRAHVDIMGHSALGGKTLIFLIDGLYGGYEWQGRPYKWDTTPFRGDWPSSLFASLDPVAIDSVAYDFLLDEWPHIVAKAGLEGGAEDYLHEAALAHSPPSETFYDPEGTETGLASLGTHEHWNNPTDKLYSRNLPTGDGIELRKAVIGDLNLDGNVNTVDYALFASEWKSNGDFADSANPADLYQDGTIDFKDLEILLHNGPLAK